MPACRKPCCCVKCAAQGSSIATRPASTSASVAPIVAMAPCRAKLLRTRCAKSGSLGSKRGSDMAALQIDVYVNVNYRPPARSRAALQPAGPIDCSAVLARAGLEQLDADVLRID